MSRQDDGRLMAAALRFLGKLPLSWAVAFGGAVGWLIGIAPLRFASPRRQVLLNLLICYPFLSWHECRRLARRNLRQIGRSFAEFAHIWVQKPEKSLARITAEQGLEEYREAVRSQQPVLVLSLHQSSWEILNLVLGREGGAMTMYNPDGRPAMDSLIRHARERTGCSMITADNRGVRAALGALNKGGTVAILADHNPGPNNPFAPFFGHEVATPALINKLVQRYRPRVFFVSCYRGAGMNDVRVFFERDLRVEQGTDERETLTAVNQGLERAINRSPVQYHWAYKRFRRGPGVIRPWYRKPNAVRILRQASRGVDRESLGLMPSSSEGQQHGH